MVVQKWAMWHTELQGSTAGEKGFRKEGVQVKSEQDWENVEYRAMEGGCETRSRERRITENGRSTGEDVCRWEREGT